MRFETLVDSPPWRIDHLPGPGEGLVIAFASIGHDAGRPPSPEFVRAACGSGRPALFVIDAARSWATAPGLDLALTTALGRVRARQPITRILGLGVSMGAFTALAAAQVLAFDAILALGSQHRPADPAETRWRDWTTGLPPDLEAALPPQTWTVLMHGMLDDAAQALAFPHRPNVDHLLFPDQSHASLALHLKAVGGLGGMIDAGLTRDRRRLLRLASAAGAVRRRP
jgi:hypothetical protein